MLTISASTFGHSETNESRELCFKGEVPRASVDPVQKAVLPSRKWQDTMLERNRGKKTGRQEREEERRDSGCFSARTVSFCNITYEAGYFLQKENIN
jgi:hypothetical protein